MRERERDTEDNSQTKRYKTHWGSSALTLNLTSPPPIILETHLHTEVEASRVRCSRKYRRNPLWSGSLIIITSIEIFALVCARVSACGCRFTSYAHPRAPPCSLVPSLSLKADDNAAYGSIAGVATPGSLPPSFHSILRFVRRRATTHTRAYTYTSKVQAHIHVHPKRVHVYAHTVAHVFGRKKAWSLLDGHRRRLAEIRPVR